MNTVSKTTFIGGPKDGKVLQVPNIDNRVKFPIANPNLYQVGVDPYPQRITYDIAVYERNLYMPEYFNFVGLESETRSGNSAQLESLDEGLEPPE